MTDGSVWWEWLAITDEEKTILRGLRNRPDLSNEERRVLGVLTAVGDYNRRRPMCCTTCKHPKPQEDFLHPVGLMRRRCGACEKAYQEALESRRVARAEEKRRLQAVAELADRLGLRFEPVDLGLEAQRQAITEEQP